MIEDWGSHTWIMFHTLAEKIKNEYNISNELINIIINISYNLPCPYCTEDAKKYIKSNFNKNKNYNKEEVITFLYNFHNHVNNKLNKQQFEKENLEIYKKKNTIQIVNNFINRYTISSNRGVPFYKSLQSKYVIMNYINFYKLNEHKFEK